MDKLYPKTTSQIKLAPKKETLKFLLDYSKALKVIDVKTEKFKVILN
ncbi:hypothetical protein BN863_14300 [Formosa agariphila KMM 3901]|uniref:Uncharacterized protein n=1 Tax=Formosa agariphila (strain DSM 15362 / KCTC 12365 / LMG 23005 / KMM 3901 / M-2Alg 35-1) TaxID=1347342 RepID=T2KJS1_FORAG|nr:hypothetical protein [Formosa agariphila]CDF79142.1 hypothetical protein BN863_14300 [Formosa agariphila KMM 3901]